MNLPTPSTTADVGSVPSRHDNPFATCWTRPGVLPFLFDGQSGGEELVARLAMNSWRGQIIGPHGSGKSTLLATLRPLIEARGWRVVAVTLRDGERRLPRELLRRGADSRRRLLMIDGYEQLGWFERWRLRRCHRRRGIGLLVTSHDDAGFPTLHATRPDLELARRLVSVLCAHAPTAISLEQVAASHARHGSNLREFLFELYDHHEAQRRPP